MPCPVGLALAHQTYGRLPWPRLVEPAVRVAEEGFAVSPALAQLLGAFITGFGAAYPASVAAFTKRGKPHAAGSRMRQPDLARTLARIRDQGRDGFCRGETTRLIASPLVCGSH